MRVAVPHLPHGLSTEEVEAAQRDLLQGLLAEQGIADYVALVLHADGARLLTRALAPAAIVYDCMDELSLLPRRAADPAGAGAPAAGGGADLVFTGGQSLYEAKRERHPNVHAFPSSIERRALRSRPRGPPAEPADQAAIPRPRLGYFGVIDERMDLELLAAAADARPDWQLVMLGPVVKIDPASLPRRRNHPLSWREGLRRPAVLPGRLGRRP